VGCNFSGGALPRMGRRTPNEPRRRKLAQLGTYTCQAALTREALAPRLLRAFDEENFLSRKPLSLLDRAMFPASGLWALRTTNQRGARRPRVRASSFGSSTPTLEASPSTTRARSASVWRRPTHHKPALVIPRP
jgi:hypothetical protein